MNAGDFMVDWFFPILIMVAIGVFIIGWLKREDEEPIEVGLKIEKI